MKYDKNGTNDGKRVVLKVTAKLATQGCVQNTEVTHGYAYQMYVEFILKKMFVLFYKSQLN